MLQRISSLSGQVDTLTQEVERLSVGRGDSVEQGVQVTNHLLSEFQVIKLLRAWTVIDLLTL